MATVAFIGLGNMGGPMAKNLVAAGHAVTVFDLMSEACADLLGESIPGSLGYDDRCIDTPLALRLVYSTISKMLILCRKYTTMFVQIRRTFSEITYCPVSTTDTSIFSPCWSLSTYAATWWRRTLVYGRRLCLDI